jgi:hypothetical protein
MGLDMYLYRKKVEVEEVSYWRKANAIHGWFMQFTDIDNCTPVPITKENLVDLRDTCAEVLRIGTVEAAEELLPPTAGFFFGSREVDEWYWQGIKNTIATLNDIIDTSTDEEEFEYQASW